MERSVRAVRTCHAARICRNLFRARHLHIEAESLYFDSSSSEIEAEGDVRVSSDDGIFSGTGFKGDLREDSYSFSSIKEGVFNL